MKDSKGARYGGVLAKQRVTAQHVSECGVDCFFFFFKQEAAYEI